jgi:Ca2+-binding RTX toxin-like protein
MDGGDGSDHLSGQGTMYGGPDADVLAGQYGHQELHGGPGADLIKGGATPDTEYGDEGNDVLRGGGGSDFLDGGADDGPPGDRCFTGGGQDVTQNCEEVTTG